ASVGWYDYGARWYDPATARFPSIDRFADQFAWQSPYVYAGNNPVKYIDVNGDSLNVSDLMSGNSTGGQELINSLQRVSGLALEVDSETGNVSISGRYRDENGRKVGGSKTARRTLKSLIQSETTVNVVDNTGDGTKVVNHENKIRWDPRQVSFTQNYLSRDLDPEAWGGGLTFYHELGHTRYGGSMADPGGAEAYTSPGDIEIIPNQIRRELGSRFGQRLAYKHTEITTMYDGVEIKGRYLPFSQEAFDAIRRGQAPSRGYHGPL
ncbi:MAG: hypothetical protein KDC54_00985, partial [Lewinella sp.]|nr:hypothetical protein [Lewinella sp.]